MTLLEFINSKKRGFFLPDMAANGLLYTGYKAIDVFNDPKKQLEIAKLMDEKFDSDFSYPLSDGCILLEALGLEILRPDYDLPSVLKHPVKNREILRSLKVSDPYKDGRLPVNLESFKLIRENIDKPFYVSIHGPFTMAVQLVGARELLRCIIKDPEFVEEVVEFTTKCVKSYASAVSKIAGYISIAEPSSVMLNSERFDKFVKPYLNDVYSGMECWKGLHICGDTREILDNMISCDTDALSLDQVLDLTEIAPKIPKDMVLIGNLAPVEVLGEMDSKGVKTESLKLVKNMRCYNNYLFGFGCNCLNDTPTENLTAAIEVGRMEYNKLDEIDA